VKDLDNLGRDLSKTLIVDNLEDSFQYQMDNGILIKSWYDDMDDDCLVKLLPFLVGKDITQIW
jgi:TFIIF-interacting CTD phosphatase-like protein